MLKGAGLAAAAGAAVLVVAETADSVAPRKNRL
jgi:hypothetical protein